MSPYRVQHLHSGETFERPATFINPHHTSDPQRWRTDAVDPAIEAFHRALPDHAETPMHELPALAAELGVANIFLKDESKRFGLPAFKILGASWAVHRTMCEVLEISSETSFDRVRQTLSAEDASMPPLKIVACTEGNWGRALARMGKYLGISVTIYVPGLMSEYTRSLLRDESAEVIVLDDGTYDDCIAAAKDDAERTGASLIMDTSWEGYEQIPQWVVNGYTTMLTETDRQVSALTNGQKANTFFVSVGVGSWAHAVVMHYKAANSNSRIVCVEPESAACLKESLHCGHLQAISTGHTIMAGMCCGTPSAIAYPVLRDGVSAAVAINEREAHASVEYLQAHGIHAGPCGAATLASMQKYLAQMSREERKGMSVVLFSTEGSREYDVPP